ncbi:MAG: class GN sortase [Holophagales bacterium]|nr:class GN sortase [Holophagales bacterium]
MIAHPSGSPENLCRACPEAAGSSGVVRRRRLGAALAAAGLGLGLWGAWIPVKAAAAQVLLGMAWARSAEGGLRVAPWPWADTWPVGRLRVPSRGVDQIVLEGASGSVLAFAPGRSSGSWERVVIGGHRDTHFAFLRQLAPGETLYLRLAGREEREYRVGWSAVVDHREQDLLGDPDRDALVLVTCYPFDALVPGGPLRFVVWADPADAGIRATAVSGIRDRIARKPGLEGAGGAVEGWFLWLARRAEPQTRINTEP